MFNATGHIIISIQKKRTTHRLAARDEGKPKIGVVPLIVPANVNRS